MTTTPLPLVPFEVDAPAGPQLTLVGSALRPAWNGDKRDPDGLLDAAIAEIDLDLRNLLKDSQFPEEEWISGLQYAPRNLGAASLRSPFDYSTIDYNALSAPSGLAGTPSTSAGTLAAGTYKYQVTALDTNGETTPCALITVVLASTGEIVLTWDEVADYAQYRVYGRVNGSIGLLATVGPFTADGGNPTSPRYVDSSATSVGAAPPSTNTTAGPGVYTNPAIVKFVPFLIDVEDTCSAFGFQRRDFIGRALEWLDAATPQAIEAEFWSGALAQANSWPNNYLTNSATVTDLTPGTVPSIARGLQILQDALAQYGLGGQGMIHVQQETASNLLTVRRVGKQMFDLFDNLVVPGVGYPGTAPGGTTPSTGYAYIYATDMPMVFIEKKPKLSIPDSFAEALDWGQAGLPNTITFHARRHAAVLFDGQRQYACKVALAT